MKTDKEIIKYFNITLSATKDCILIDDYLDLFNKLQIANVISDYSSSSVSLHYGKIRIVFPYKITLEKFLVINEYRKCFLSLMDD